MAKPSPLNDGERAELVAYLDGELDESAAAALEAKLHLDPSARGEAEQLRRTWELLDYLPRPQPSIDFTHRTLERVVAESRAAHLPSRFWTHGRLVLKGLAWAAAILVAVEVGFRGSRLLPQRAPVVPPPVEASKEIEPEWVKDFGVIRNRRLYEPVDNMSFLRKLTDPNDPDLFGEDNVDS